MEFLRQKEAELKRYLLSYECWIFLLLVCLLFGEFFGDLFEFVVVFLGFIVRLWFFYLHYQINILFAKFCGWAFKSFESFYNFYKFLKAFLCISELEQNIVTFSLIFNENLSFLWLVEYTLRNYPLILLKNKKT